MGPESSSDVSVGFPYLVENLKSGGGLMGLVLALLAAILPGCVKQNQPHAGKKNMEQNPEENSEFKSDLEPPSEVTPTVFAKWRDARRGQRQAESQNNPYWTWLLQSKTSAYFANQHFGGPSSYGEDGSPVWEASRFGQSRTELADGRQILIGGEHEDFYDPDFFIYNDVIICHPDGTIDFLGYPTDAFPPTDFHSATLIDHKIILIGNLSYVDDRKPDTTQILIVDTETWKVSEQASSGDLPGWIHDHSAELAEDNKSILITGGNIYPADDELPIIENIDDWRLNVEDWSWERLTERNWPLFEITRTDGERNKIWEIRQVEFELRYGDHPELLAGYKKLTQDTDPKTIKKLQAATKFRLPKNTKALDALYHPDNIPHQRIPERETDEDEEDDLSEFGVTRIDVQGTNVRYKEDSHNFMMTIEGDLAKETIDALVEDLVGKLSRVEGVEYQAKRIRG